MKKYENWQDLQYKPPIFRVIRACHNCGEVQEIDPIRLVSCKKCYQVARPDKWIIVETTFDNYELAYVFSANLLEIENQTECISV